MAAMASVSRLLLLLALSTGLAHGQTLLTPASATASTEYSSLYDIGNTIDGSGLPGGFGLTDVHADYATNNHWTTNGDTVSAQSIGSVNRVIALTGGQQSGNVCTLIVVHP